MYDKITRYNKVNLHLELVHATNITCTHILIPYKNLRNELK